jgi:plastocyanin
MVEMSWSTARGTLAIISAALLVLAAACSKSDSTPSPTPEPTTGNTITITASGASPRSLVVPLGSQVTFINNDSVAHEMYSDPHPEHTDCPEFDSVGRLTPGTTRQTKNLITTRTCGFHDHINPFVASLTGSIRIQ